MLRTLLRAWMGLILAGLSLAGGASAHAQAGEGLHVERRGAERIELDAGQHATVVFRILNQSGRPLPARPRFVLPDGWRSLGSVNPATVAPGTADIRILPFSIPSNAPAGRYALVLEADERGHARDSVVVDIRPRVELDVTAIEAPPFAVAGESYDALFRVQNRGNAQSLVALDLRSGDFEAEAELRDLSLAPGEAREIPVRVHIGDDVTRNQRHVLRLEARTGEGDAAVTASANSVVDVLPAPGHGADHLYRLPLSATLRATPEGDIGGEISGSTPLFGGRGRMELLLRRPPPGPAIFGASQDEYRLRLQTPGLDLRLGDHVYRLSPLTSRFRQGFGAGAEVPLGRLSVEGFAEQDRRGFHEGARAGGALRLRLGGSTVIGAHHILDRGERGGQTTSVRGETRLGRLLRADAEYGWSEGTSGPAEAYAVNASGGVSRLSYSLRHVRGDRGFLGAYAGSAVDAGQLRIRPFGQLWLHGALSLQETRSRLTGDLRETRQLRAGAQYGSLVSGEYRQEERAWTAGERVSATDTRTGALRVTLPVGPLRLQPRAELGVTTDMRTGQEQPFRRLGMGASIRSAGSLSLSTSVEHTSGSPSLTGALRDRLTGFVNAGLRVGGTALHLTAHGTHYTGSTLPTRGYIDLRLEQALPYGHQVALRGRMNAFGGALGGADPLIAAAYTIPLSVPIGRRGDVSRVVGRLYDAESGRGVGGVLVQLGGRTAITDPSGRLTITGSEQGVQHLRVDRHSTGLDRVIDRPAPLEVEVREGGTTRVDLPLVRAARVTGQVRLMAFEGPRGRETVGDAGGVPNVLVEISRGDEVHRRVSDANGRFEFPDLRPGEWQVSLDEDALPPHHDWDEVSLDLDVLPGETEEVTFRQVPRRRNVVIVQQGELTVGERADAPPAEPARTEPTPAAPAAPRRGAESDAEPDAPAPARAERRGILGEPADQPEVVARPVPLPAAEAPGTVVIPSEGFTVTVTTGDRSLRQMARVLYGDERLWARIWLANRDMLPRPDALFPGQVLRIPPDGPATEEEIRIDRAYSDRDR